MPGNPSFCENSCEVRWTPGSSPGMTSGSIDEMRAGVDTDGLAGHVARLGCREETDRVGDVFRGRRNLQRHLCDHGIADLRRTVGATALGEPGRVHIAGANGIDANERR